nr:ribonuclease H-like domain-containing protein [Tanacetum cinerariifolium]
MQTQTSNTLHNAIMKAGGKDRPPMLAPDKVVPLTKGSSETTTERYMENYKNVSQDIRDQLNAEAEAVQIILTGIDNDIYSTVDACPNACEMWKAIERLKQGESINVQDLETNLYWEFGKFTSRDGESLESYHGMMNELVKNQCDVTNHQVNVQFLPQLQPEWQRFVTLVKHSQELKTVSYHKLYDILKQHQNEVNELRAERLARTANPLALVAQQQPVYNPQNHPTHYTQNSSTRSQQAATINRGKVIVNSPLPIYDQEPSMVAEDDEMSKDKEIDKLMDLISLSFKKIYKPTNNNLRTSSNTSRANQDNFPRINRGIRYDNQRICNVVGARETVAMECQKPKRVKDAAYHKEKMLLCKQEEARFQLNAKQANWRDDTDDKSEDQELEAQYMYMVKLQEVTPDAADNSGPIFDTEPLQQNRLTRMMLKGEIKDFKTNERDLRASLIEKLKCEIDDNKNRNKFLETSNKALVDKLKGEIEDFKTKNKILESSNNHFKEANNKLSETNELMYKDLKKFQAELDRHSLKSQLETQKTQFLNEIDRLSREYYYADQMNAILGVYTELDEVINLQSQLQDKGIAISELKKLIEKLKGKSVETKFEKSSVVQQPNAFKSQRPSILGKPTIFSDSLERKDCSKSKYVTKNNVLNDFSKPVTAHILPPNKKSILKNTNVLAPGMYKLHTEPTQTRTTQLPYDFRKTNKCVSFSTGVIPPTSVSRPQLKSNQIEDRVTLNNSQGKKQEVEDILVKIILFIVDSGCSKHITGNLKLLTNFVEKFLGTVKFRNDQIAPILGYGDLNDIVIGLLKLKFVKDHLCSSCELGKAKRKSFQSKTTPSSKRRLQLLHMDLCGPMRVESINGRKYVLVIVDDYSRYTWTYFLRSKEKTPEVLIDFLRLV